MQVRNPNKQCLFTPSNSLRKFILSNREWKFLTEIKVHEFLSDFHK